MHYGEFSGCKMRKGYWIMGGLVAGGVILHVLLWSVFPDARTALAALLMWVILGVGHIFIYALQSRGDKALVKVVVVPALIRLVVLPMVLVGLVLAFDPHVKTFLVLFVGEVFLLMGLELGLVYSSQRPPASS
jgi:hypothetical protein